MGEYFTTNQIQAPYNLNKNMEYSVIKLFAKPCSKIREVPSTRDPIFKDPSIDPIGMSILRMMEPDKEFLKGPKSFNVTKQLQQEQRAGVIGISSFLREGMSNQASDKGEVNQRSNKPGLAEITLRRYINEPLFVFVPAEHMFFRSWESLGVFDLDRKVDITETSKNVFE